MFPPVSSGETAKAHSQDEVHDAQRNGGHHEEHERSSPWMEFLSIERKCWHSFPKVKKKNLAADSPIKSIKKKVTPKLPGEVKSKKQS